MRKRKMSKSALNLKYAKILQDYQILSSSIMTYWIALVVGLIIAFITEKKDKLEEIIKLLE